MAPTNPLPDGLRTGRLALRPARVEDAVDIFAAYARDPEVCRYMIWRPSDTEDQTRDYLRQCVENCRSGAAFAYAIVVPDAASERLVGMFEARRQEHAFDVGYVLARSAWGRGLMPEALSAFAGAALSQPDVFRIQATCDVENVPSRRALEKAGFVREGLLGRFTVHPALSPEPRPCFMYAACR